MFPLQRTSAARACDCLAADSGTRSPSAWYAHVHDGAPTGLRGDADVYFSLATGISRRRAAASWRARADGGSTARRRTRGESASLRSTLVRAAATLRAAFRA